MGNKRRERRNIFTSVWVGIGATWFGVHMGPGSAAGKQAATFYGRYGTWGFIAPFISMAILGFVVYLVIEYMRINKLSSYHDFFQHFFAPNETFFSIVFDILFFATFFMSIGGALFTGATIMSDQTTLSYFICIAIIAIISIALIIYGETVVRIANSFMTYVMLGILFLITVFALKSPQNIFVENLSNPKISWNFSLLSGVLISTITYAAFQVTGNVGAVAAVVDGLKDKAESKKAAIFGWFVNSLLILITVIMHFGLQEFLEFDMPNYEILKILGVNWLFWAYVILVEMAVISSIIGMCSGVISRIEKNVPIKSKKIRKASISFIFIIGAAFVSLIGLTKIVNVGFTYLGYSCIFLVILPILFIGFKKVLKNKDESLDIEAREHLQETKK